MPEKEGVRHTIADFTRLNEYATTDSEGKPMYDLNMAMMDIMALCKINGETKEMFMSKASQVWDSFTVRADA